MSSWNVVIRAGFKFKVQNKVPETLISAIVLQRKRARER